MILSKLFPSRVHRLRGRSGTATALMLLCCASLIAFDAAELFLARKERLAQAGREVSNLSASIAQYCQGAVETADTALIGLRDEAAHYGTHAANLAVLQGLMFQYLGALPSLHSLFLLDSHGNALISTFPETQQGLNFAAQDYFRFHLLHITDLVFVGSHDHSQADNNAVVTVTRRFDDTDGRFAGVLSATLSAGVFKRMLDSFDVGPHGTITLNDDAGRVIARVPYDARFVGRDVSHSDAHHQADVTADGREFRFISVLDGKVRLGASHRVGRTPLRVLVARSEVDILAPWWAEVRVNLACLVAVIAVALYLSRRLDVGLRARAQVEAALEIANAELSAIAVTDALTGIANRRHFDQTLSKEWNRAMRTASPVALLMIDVDHFKTFNDRFGHLAGDQCLRDLAQTISGAVLRAGDLVSRYGGEEFAVILPDTLAEQAAQVAGRIQLNLMARAIAHPDAKSGHVTVSVGVASAIPTPGSTPDGLIVAADMALYRAKDTGRDCVRIAEARLIPRAPVDGRQAHAE